MSIVFLIGGTGNQLFQYAASAPNDKFSCIFLQSHVRRLLRWTDHEQLIEFPKAPWYSQAPALIILVLDLILAHFFRISLFSALDLRQHKATPLVAELNRFGYFQNAPENRDLAAIVSQISPKNRRNRIVVHVRGGDLVAIEKAGQNAYGMLDRTYFEESLNLAKAALAEMHSGRLELLIITDDLDYATTLKLGLPETGPVEIINSSLAESLSLAVGADWFVASNSTLSYWIVRLRNGDRSIAPQPFQKRSDYILPENTTRIFVYYG